MSTTLRTIPVERADGSTAPATPGTGEPQILVKERSVLREILRLVAERAVAEAKVEGERALRDGTADSEYAKARHALVEKLGRLEREAKKADEELRRSIVDAAIQGEAKAKAEFSANSRKIASTFDGVRESAKAEHHRAKAEAASTHETAMKKAAREHADKIKPIADMALTADSFRERLAAVAAEYTKFRLDPEPPQPVPETYTKFDDPEEELFTRLSRMDGPLRLLEKLLIPKVMKGAREAWVYLLLIVPLVGAAFAMEMDVSYLGIAAVVGGVLGFLLRTWLVKLSKTQLERLYVPLMQSLADADGLNAYCRDRVNAQHQEIRRRLSERRDLESKLRGRSAPQGRGRWRGPARRTAPQDQRGLCRADGGSSDDARARPEKSPRRPRPSRGRLEGPVRRGLPQARKPVQRAQGTNPRSLRVRLASDGRPLARGDEPCDRRARRDQSRG